jgi:hypothetical protein
MKKKYYEKRVEEGAYSARIATTFALHRPWTKVFDTTVGGEHRRTAYPYQARHLPWYENSKELPGEMLYYKEHATTITSWTSKTKLQKSDSSVEIFSA